MRIAILTLPLYTNYGGILQCYALQTVLQRMGHDVKVLTKPRYGFKYYLIYPFAVLKRMFRRILFNENIGILKAPHEIIRRDIDKFIYARINFYSSKNWKLSVPLKFDAVIVGSDQVWRPSYCLDIETMFLSFLGNSRVKRIAYAASFGRDDCLEFSKSQLENCKELLQSFNGVSVREKSGVDICKNIFKVDAVQLLDPTLLLNSNDYSDLIQKVEDPFSDRTMFVYILDYSEEKKKLVDQIAREKCLKVYWINEEILNSDVSWRKRVKKSIEQWLYCFNNATFILTDSFHGCVFSIIFKKQFIAIANEERGVNRFNSLFKSLFIDDRLIFSVADYEMKKVQLSKDIDYDKVSKVLECERERSCSFIMSLLNKIS